MGTYSNQIHGIDIPSIYLAAQQYRANEDSMRQREADRQRQEQERQRQEQLRSLYAGAISGNQQAIAGLQQQDPQGFMELEKQQQASQAAQAEQARRQQDQAIQNATTTGNMLRAVKASKVPEQTYQAVRQQAIQMGLGTEDALPLQYDPQWVDTMLAQSEAIHRSRAEGIGTVDWQNYQHTKIDPGFKEHLEQNRRAGAPNIQLTMPGNAPVSQKTRGEQEGELLDAENDLVMLDEIKTLATDNYGNTDFGQFLGWWPKGKKATLSLIEEVSGFVPASQRDWYGRASAFRTRIDEYKAGRYNKLLGSAQSAAEVRNLANAVLSADMGTTQFNEAYRRLQSTLQRKIRVAQQVLGEGLDLGTLAYRKRFDEIERAQKAKQSASKRTVSPDVAKAIMAEGNRLLAEGKSREEVKKILQSKMDAASKGGAP